MTAPSRLSTPQELRTRLAAERAGLPFVLYRSPGGSERLVTLRDEQDRVLVGRGEGCEIRLELDPEVSRIHAELQRAGSSWLVSDDGLSRNGTFVNGDRLVGRRRLRHGDVIRCGSALIAFYDPAGDTDGETRPASGTGEVRITDAQRRVLVALCRPLGDGDRFATPASNSQIAGELYLSVQAVKAHLRGLFDKLGIDDLPHNQKRLRLAQAALEQGLVGFSELR
jgi:pSer/pThr/pTyr-binding forkhead associated (FHA) protein